jgi:general secretion pathway protein C
MKRMPLILSLLAVIALSASVAFWAMQLFKPAERPIAPIVEAPPPPPQPDAAATLFGGQAVTAAPSNYQLTGVVAAGRDSVAILVADGQPPRALMVGREIASGVVVKEVHPKYVMLSEGGMLKRIELATDAKAGSSLALAAPTAGQPMQYQQPQYQQPQPTPQPMQVPDNPNNSVPVPPPQAGQPMEVPVLPPGVPPPPPVQMPAPTRNVSGQGGQPPTQ